LESKLMRFVAATTVCHDWAPPQEFRMHKGKFRIKAQGKAGTTLALRVDCA
jgi:hypothetical protein